MNRLSQLLYWKSPYAVKCWLASLNARRLDRERYGPEYERLLEEIAERDAWPRERFERYQLERLRGMLRHAIAKVPHYRAAYSDAGVDPDGLASLEDLRRLPILEKETVRADPQRLVDETLSVEELIVEHTSGTTGTPVDLYRDARLCSTASAYFDARCHETAGMRRRRNRSVSIGGHLVTEPDRDRPPFWVHNRRWNQLYLSSYHLSPRYLDSYVDELRRFGADYIEGYPSSVHAIAQHIVESRDEPLRFQACFTTAETLFDFQRDAIREAFGCRTYNQYGCGEMAVFATECGAGSMHISPDYGIVEVVDENDGALPAGRVGQLICTSLVNRVQPFLRYRMGDMASLEEGPCGCGSPLPRIGQIEGRTDAVLITRDGRRIGRLDPVFKGTRGIREAQVVQDDLDRFRVRIVPSPSYEDADGRVIANNLSQRVGGGEIRIEIVDSIERTAAGKFRAVVCNLPDPGSQ